MRSRCRSGRFPRCQQIRGRCRSTSSAVAEPWARSCYGSGLSVLRCQKGIQRRGGASVDALDKGLSAQQTPLVSAGRRRTGWAGRRPPRLQAATACGRGFVGAASSVSPTSRHIQRRAPDARPAVKATLARRLPRTVRLVARSSTTPYRGPSLSAEHGRHFGASGRRSAGAAGAAHADNRRRCAAPRARSPSALLTTNQVGEFDNAALDALQIVAAAGQQQQHEHVDHVGDRGLRLADADRLDDHDVEAGGLAQQQRLAGAPRDPAQGWPAGEGRMKAASGCERAPPCASCRPGSSRRRARDDGSIASTARRCGPRRAAAGRTPR